MMRIRHILATAGMLMACTLTWAQNEIVVSQYIHNQFAVNPAFAGSREGLTVFGSFRKKWASIEGAPTSFLLTGHTPMRHEKLTGGLTVFGQGIHESTNAGILMIGYRTKIGDNAHLGLALQPGVSFRSTDWTKVKTTEEDDVIFNEKKSATSPLMGFGISVYGKKFFAGASINSLFVSDDFEYSSAKFAPADATMIFTGGYLFAVNERIAIQPSVLVDYNKADGMAADIMASGIFDERLWISLAYRTIKDMTLGLAFNVKPQFRIAYSYTMNSGDISGYSSGHHELSLQYDFIYHVRTVGHKFY